MKKLIILISLTFTFFTGPVNAHMDHDAKPVTINEEQAATVASYHIKRLVKAGTIDTLWQTVEAQGAVLERRNSRYSWIISFVNPQQEDDAQKTLYIFLSNSGYFLAKNFTGK